MYRLAWLLIPAAAAFCHQPRYARMGEFDGKPEVQIQAADPWQPAVRNAPLPQSARVQTNAASHAEIELDDGSVVRLAPDSFLELSDYTRLSSGQRLTLISLDRGMLYFTGQTPRQDSLLLAVPGAQITVQQGTRLRIEARDQWSQIAVIEGKVRFASPSAEMDLAEGDMARVDPTNRVKFYLYREISPYGSDRWSEDRDKLLASATSAAHVPNLRYGAQDLDTGGTWVDTETFGTVWKPKVADGWMPYQGGRWAWYDDLGYTWIASEQWGWLPYHYGRWSRTADLGWFWVPGRNTTFKPGDVYWLRGARMAGWGPLAPGEDWRAGGLPQLYLAATTSWADFAQDARVIDPEGFTARPKDPLTVAAFAMALPSPAFLASRLEATRPPLRTGVTRILPMISGVTYEDAGTLAQAPPPPIQDPPVAAAPPPPPPPVIVAMPPPEPPIEIYYPVPVYTGVVVINPPDRGAKPADRAPGPQPADTSGRTVSSRRKPVDANPPTPPRGDDPGRDHRAASGPRGEPPVHITPPPRENPQPAAPRTPSAPSVQPSHEPARVEAPPPVQVSHPAELPPGPRIPTGPAVQPSHEAKPVSAPAVDKDKK
jgi:hypothetical protein